MMTLLISLLAFLLALLILVGIHEYGHFMTARLCGVKVLRFSFGFGKVLWSRRDRKGTEYTVCAFPLGGYVKMLDEKEAPVPNDQLAFAFNRQSVWKRFAVVVAGPVFNFLFAIILFWLIFMIGTKAVVPLVGAVTPNSPAAAAGVKPGDIIKTIDQRATENWRDVHLSLLKHLGAAKQIELTVQQRGSQTRRRLELKLPASPLKLSQNLLAEAGIRPFTPKLPPVIAKVVPDSPAQKGGLQAGDKVIKINALPIRDWQQLVSAIKSKPEQKHKLVVNRNGHSVSVTVQARWVEEPDGTKVPMLGIQSQRMKWPADLLYKQQFGPLAAWVPAVKRFATFTGLTFKVIGKLLTGQLAWRNVSGPIGIAQGAGQSAQRGLNTYLGFLALVSIGLGVLNLLPIPVLDGGHLFYYVIEIVRRKPLSDAAQVMGMKIGVILLILLMGVAFYNDILRLI